MGDFASPFNEMVKMLELHIISQILDWDEKFGFLINTSSLLGSYFGILTCVEKSRARDS
jgi:hypothetical protein